MPVGIVRGELFNYSFGSEFSHIFNLIKMNRRAFIKSAVATFAIPFFGLLASKPAVKKYGRVTADVDTTRMRSVKAYLDGRDVTSIAFDGHDGEGWMDVYRLKNGQIIPETTRLHGDVRFDIREHT